MRLAVGTTIAGYEVIAELHAGGMGEVYLARRLAAHGFEKLVALKTVRADLQGRSDLHQAFHSEARLVARLSHQTIAQVHDFVDEGGAAFLVMEYVDGVSFQQLVQQCGALPPEIACRAVSEVCRGLHAAHELRDASGAPLRVVHRDVSPQNLMLTFDGGVKILDFGIAKFKGSDSPVTAVGVMKGKPGYMAPEQVRMGAIDRRTDIFLVGIVLHELLTGKRLFVADSLVALAHMLINQPVAPPTQIRPGLPDELVAIIMRCLAREPEGRPSTAVEVADILDAVVAQFGGESLEAFSRRVLADTRVAHEERRRGTTGVAAAALQDGKTLPAGRAAGANTATATPETPAKPPTAVRRRWLGASVGVALALIASALFWVFRPVAPRTVAPSTPSHAAVATPRPVEEAPPVVGAQPSPEPQVPPEPNAAQPLRTRPMKKTRRPSAAIAESTAAGPAGVAYLTIGADPYALVRVNGQEVGSTPLFDLPVSAGRIDLELLTPDQRHVRLHQQLELAPGQHQRVTAPR